jgi:hypothetical protein
LIYGSPTKVKTKKQKNKNKKRDAPGTGKSQIPISRPKALCLAWMHGSGARCCKCTARTYSYLLFSSDLDLGCFSLAVTRTHARTAWLGWAYYSIKVCVPWHQGVCLNLPMFFVLNL